MRPTTRTVLITGSSGGIGSPLARHLSEQGWTVFASVRSLEAGKNPFGGRGNIVAVELDVCEPRSIAKAREVVTEHLQGQGLFAVINNAGTSADGPLEIVAIDALRRQFEINVIGAIAVSQAFLPLLRMCRGRIINMGGGAGRITVPMYGALSASKAALDSVSDAFRMELKYQGVDIIYMEPGGIDTEFFKKSAETALQGGLAGGAEGGRIYRRAINAVKRAFSQSKPEPVDVIVTAIMKALTAPRPSPRYVVGKENRMHLMLLPKLPTRVRDRIVMSAFGLTKDLFV